MLSLSDALVYTFVMALVIFACRAFPFIVFRNKAASVKQAGFTGKLVAFVERTAPSVTMTVLAFNALASEIVYSPASAPAVAAGGAVTAILHIAKRNALISIAGGVAVYALLPLLSQRLNN